MIETITSLFGLVNQGLFLIKGAVNTVLVGPLATYLSIPANLTQASIALAATLLVLRRNAVAYPILTYILMWAGLYALLGGLA